MFKMEQIKGQNLTERNIQIHTQQPTIWSWLNILAVRHMIQQTHTDWHVREKHNYVWIRNIPLGHTKTYKKYTDLTQIKDKEIQEKYVSTAKYNIWHFVHKRKQIRKYIHGGETPPEIHDMHISGQHKAAAIMLK